MVLIRAGMVPLYEQNPFATHQRIPEDKKDKLTIKGLPLSVSNIEVKTLLESKRIVLSSQVKYGYMRDDNGTLTSYKNGDRFVYCTPFDPPISRQQKIGEFNCLVFHHGKDNQMCRSCNTMGHRSGDARCAAKAEEGSILAFSGYQHPLSNHFLTPIKAFDLNQPFKSIEHAFFWRMAIDLGKEDLAERIKDAVHAGVVKRLSKEIDDDDRQTWEDDNLDVMKQLLIEKAKTCLPFRNCLKMNKDKMLAECTHSKRWATGLSKGITENTKPDYWPGTNLLGMMLMEITEEQLLSHNNQDSTESSSINPNNSMTTSSNTVVSEEADALVPIPETSDPTTSGDVSAVAAVDNASSTSGGESTTSGLAHCHTDTSSSIISSDMDQDISDDKMPVNLPQKMTVKTANNTSRKKKSKQKLATIETSTNTPKSVMKETPLKQNPDIRSFMDPITGKRKTTDTTPEKNNNEKKISK